MGQRPRNPTRSVRIGDLHIGAGHPVAVQSMAATRTQDIDATLRQVRLLEAAGADVIRIAVDSRKDTEALAEIAGSATRPLSVDLQENYRLAEVVAPHVQKIRYNPGHLYHHERRRPERDKVAYLAEVAAANDCAMRVGVNCGSVDPAKVDQFPADDSIGPMLASALEHCEMLDSIGFERYCVSLKDSDPNKVIDANRRFAEQRPDVPLHLGVHRGRHASRRRHQDPHRLRAAPRPTASATRSASPSPCPSTTRARRSPRAAASSRTSRPAASGRCPGTAPRG